MQNLIFGTDGIRGIANRQLSANLIFFIGKALGIKLLQTPNVKHCVIVGRDNRQSSDMLFCALSSGLMSVGINVWDVGIVTTPALSYLVSHNVCDAGVMITASHNSAEYNGIKIFDNAGHKIMPDYEQELVSIYNNIESFVCNESIGIIYDKKDLIHSYIDKVIDYSNDISIKNIKIAIDCANGAGSHIIPYVFKTLLDRCDCFNCQMFNNAINKNCGSVNTASFSKIVKENYDFGFAFDGDADRLVVVQKNGQILSGEVLLYILAKYYKLHNNLKDNRVVTTILTSISIEQALAKLGICTLRCDVGDKNVWEMMDKQNACLGGEESGHIIIKDTNPTADALWVSVVLLKIFNEINFNIADYTKDIVPFCLVKDDIDVSERQKTLFSSGALKELIVNLDNELGEDSRLIVRPSGTESVIRVLIEGKNIQLMNNVVQKIRKSILEL